jgi:hypothetical protein
LESIAAVERGTLGRVTPNYSNGRVVSNDIGPFQINDKTWIESHSRICQRATSSVKNSQNIAPQTNSNTPIESANCIDNATGSQKHIQIAILKERENDQ